MKNLISMGVLFLATSLSAFAGDKKMNDVEKIAVGLINDVAGDSWAENGDIEKLEFTTLKCNLDAQVCKLEYDAKLYDKPATKGICTLQKISGYPDLIELVKYGFVLKEDIYNQVSDCMAKAGL